MDRDELKGKIKAIIAEAQEEDHHGNLLMYSGEAADLIFSLLAPELEKARKWDEVVKISKSLKVLCTSCKYSEACKELPSYLCDSSRDIIMAVFKALSKEAT